MSYGPLGDSLAAAVIIAVAFAFPGVWTIGMWLRSKHFLYSAVALAALARVGGMAIRAASISNDGANKAMMISYFMCNQAGFSIMLDMQCITIANWFKNTDTHLAPPLSKLWMKIALFCGPLAICTGLGLGVPSAVLMYGVQSDDAWDKAFILRKVIATGMTAIACVCAMLSLGGWLWTVYHRTQFKPINRVHQKIWVMFASGLFLVWSGGVRINIAFYDKNMATSREQRWYPAQEIPELLQLVAWCWPWLIVEAHYSSKTAEYWENVRSGSSKPGEITTHTAFEDGVESQPSTSSSGSHLDNVSLGQVVDVQGLSKARSKDIGTLDIIQVAPAALAKQAQAAVGQHHSFAGMSESVTSSVEDESGVALTGNATGKAGHH